MDFLIILRPKADRKKTTTMDNPFPEIQHFCQSCGMPLSDEAVSDNPDYCKYCFADGHFTQDCTMDEMIEVCVQFLDEFNKNTGLNLTADEYREQLRQYFPTLKRWQK